MLNLHNALAGLKMWINYLCEDKRTCNAHQATLMGDDPGINVLHSSHGGREKSVTGMKIQGRICNNNSLALEDAVVILDVSFSSVYPGCISIWNCPNINVNSLALGKFEWNFRYAIFKRMLVIDSWGFCCEIALIWMSLDFIDDQSTLVQVMAWCRQETRHYLRQSWPRSLSPYGVTGPQRVEILYWWHAMGF